MATDEAIIQKFIQKFNEEVKFRSSYLIFDESKIIRYNEINEIIFYDTHDYDEHLYSIEIKNSGADFNNEIFEYKFANKVDKLNNMNTIKQRIMDIFDKHMDNANSSNKQLEEISKKMDAINEKLEAIVYAPGSSLYKEIASKYAKDEKK